MAALDRSEVIRMIEKILKGPVNDDDVMAVGEAAEEDDMFEFVSEQSVKVH